MIKLSLILPAYNEEAVIGDVLEKAHSALSEIYPDGDYEIIVVNDGSTDKTGEVARSHDVRVLNKVYNVGNGAAVKTGLRAAEGELIALMDADGQHDPGELKKLIARMNEGYDMVVGARHGWRNVPFHRKIANTFYNVFASYLIGQNVRDLTSGFRIMNSDIAKRFISLLPNTFSYPSTLTMSFIRSGHTVDYELISIKKRVGKSKINLLADGIRFLLIMIKIATFFSPLKVFLPASFLCLSISLFHGVYKIIIRGEGYSGFTLLFLITGIIIFLLGLVSEQIAQMRFELGGRNA